MEDHASSPELLPTAEIRQVPALHGLLWLQRGFRLFAAQPLRWMQLLSLWLGLALVMPLMLTVALENVRKAILIALNPLNLDESVASLLGILPMLPPLAMVLLFPLVFAGLMVGCATVAHGGRLQPRHLFAALRVEPSRLVTVGGINAVGQILMSQAIAWLIHDRVGDLDFNIPSGPHAAQAMAEQLDRLQAVTPLVLPVLVLQTLLMAALWFTPPLLVFHNITPLAAVRLSISGCARNMGALSVYSLALVLMLSLVGALALSASAGIVFAVIALLVLGAAMTTMIASLYVSYCDIFQPHG